MRGTHLYERMNNTKILGIFMNMIKNNEEHVAKQLFANITKEAGDHPRYDVIKAAYDERFGTIE